jgi:hypothetical protein
MQKTLKKSHNLWVRLIIGIFSSKLQMRWPHTLRLIASPFLYNIPYNVTLIPTYRAVVDLLHLPI